MSWLKDSNTKLNEGPAAVSPIEPVTMYAILDLLQADPHQWSTRGCQTCEKITKLVGRNFGCYLYKDRKQHK